MMLKLYDDNNNPNDIDEVVEMLRDGALIIYPTDTRYAIGCDALNTHAVEKICRIKHIDPQKNNLSVICYDLSNISEYAKVDNATFKLMKRYLPGAFTFILQGTTRLPKIFRNRKEIGIRMPDNNICREICKALDAPILTTTVPLVDNEDPEYATNPELMEEKWANDIDLVIDGGIGELEESTVINCINGKTELIRQGKGIINLE